MRLRRCGILTAVVTHMRHYSSVCNCFNFMTHILYDAIAASVVLMRIPGKLTTVVAHLAIYMRHFRQSVAVRGTGSKHDTLPENVALRCDQETCTTPERDLIEKRYNTININLYWSLSR